MKAFQPFRLDVVNQCLWLGESRISLMPKPFAVLRYLVDHPGRLVTQDELLAHVWPDTYVQPEVLRQSILEIRRALGDSAGAPRFVRTFPKRGYEFIAPVTDGPEIAPAAVAWDGPSSLVGRAAALGALDGYLKAALEGRRQIVFIVGEPGIGKSSLIDAFCDRLVRSPVRHVARGQCAEGFGSQEPYYPLLEALGLLLRKSEPELIGVLAAHAPTWLVQFPGVRAGHRDLPPDITGVTRERMVRELCEALEILTQPAALVLVLEDLQWVDRSTLDVLSTVARRREPARLLLLGTLRPADLIVSESPLKGLKQDLLLHRLCHEVTLERLQESDVADYLAAGVATGDLPAGLPALIHRRSDGNPLFMIAMLDHLVQQGVLSRADGRWTMNVPLERVDPGVPDTLRQMLETQLQHSSAEEQKLLECASVAGQHFTVWSLATMLANATSSNLEEMCQTLAEREQFIKWSGTCELADGATTPEYQFRHALYRDVLNRRLTPSERVTFHGRLAEGLERLHEPVAPEMAAELALHYEEGRAYDRAIRYLIVAAQNATRRYAHQEAVGVLDRAHRLIPKLPHDQQASLELQILEKTGRAFYALGDMSSSAAAYAAMATRAAGAGLLAEQVDVLMSLAPSAESIPFFLQAVHLQPNLAAAYTNLSRIYSNLGEGDLAQHYAKLAYEHRDHVSVRERLSITYQYHYEVTGDQARATETLEEWKDAFPGEFQPANSLALIHNFLGRFEQAIEAGREAVRRNPAHGYPYSNLAHAYRGLMRLDEARETAERAVARQVETLPTRLLLYQLAVIAGDREAVGMHLDWARDKPREFDMVRAHAQVAAWEGKVREARQLYERAANIADARQLRDVGTGHLAWAIWMDVAYGDFDAALHHARRVIARAPSYDPALRTAVALAAAGACDDAERLASDLCAAHPDHTLINDVLAPVVRAAVEVGRRRPDAALDALARVAPYERGFIAALAPMYFRAQAYLLQGAGRLAAQEFQRLVDHRGSDPFSPFHAVAFLGLARAFASIGEKTDSLAAYERFLRAWQHADPDVPVLRQAREEHAQLIRGMRPDHAG